MRWCKVCLSSCRRDSRKSGVGTSHVNAAEFLRQSGRSWVGVIAGALVATAIPGIALGEHVPQFEVNAYLDQFDGVDIGEETAYTLPDTVPSLPAIDPLAGPIGSGVVSGQFEITCPTNEVGCDTPAYFAENFDWRWGLLDVNSMQFVESPGGDTFFASTFANEGFAGIDIHENQRFVHFEYALEDSGIVLEPGHDYVFFAGLSDNLNGANRVPGEDLFNPEIAVHISAALDSPPFQLHQGAPTEFMDLTNFIFVTQVATSRVIPVVPEPTSLLLLAVGAALGRKRRS